MICYGFVYLWRDRKRKMFYLGSHHGPENDGYKFSGSERLRNAYNKRPQDFKRRIIWRNPVNDRRLTLGMEDRWLKLIKKEELRVRYYNLTRTASGWPEFTQDQCKAKAQKANETLGFEGRCARAQKISENLGPAKRIARARKTNETLGPEGRKVRSRNGLKIMNETSSPEERSAKAQKGNETLGQEGRSARGRKALQKANETLGPEGRRVRSRKGHETLGLEGRRARSLKSSITRRRNKEEGIVL